MEDDFVYKNAKIHKLASIDLLDLYKNINDNFLDDYYSDFEVAGSGIGGGSIDFNIVTKYPNPLPEMLTDLFFNEIDLKFKVIIEETDLYKHRGERTFHINIKEN